MGDDRIPVHAVRRRRPGFLALLLVLAAPVAQLALFPRYAWSSLPVFLLALIAAETRRLGVALENGSEARRGA
jgi:hypothetical protein